MNTKLPERKFFKKHLFTGVLIILTVVCLAGFVWLFVSTSSATDEKTTREQSIAFEWQDASCALLLPVNEVWVEYPTRNLLNETGTIHLTLVPEQPWKIDCIGNDLPPDLDVWLEGRVEYPAATISPAGTVRQPLPRMNQAVFTWEFSPHQSGEDIAGMIWLSVAIFDPNNHQDSELENWNLLTKEFKVKVPDFWGLEPSGFKMLLIGFAAILLFGWYLLWVKFFHVRKN